MSCSTRFSRHDWRPLPAGFITFCEVYTFPAGPPRLRPTVAEQDGSSTTSPSRHQGLPPTVVNGGYLKRETERASPFFCGDLLEHSDVEHRLGQKLLQLGRLRSGCLLPQAPDDLLTVKRLGFMSIPQRVMASTHFWRRLRSSGHQLQNGNPSIALSPSFTVKCPVLRVG